MIKDLLRLLEKYSYGNLIISELPEKYTMRLMLYIIYVIPILIVAHIGIIPFRADNIICIACLNFCIYSLIDIGILYRFQLGLYYTMWLHILNAEIKVTGSVNQEEHYQKFHKIQSAYFTQEFQKIYPFQCQESIIKELEREAEKKVYSLNRFINYKTIGIFFSIATSLYINGFFKIDKDFIAIALQVFIYCIIFGILLHLITQFRIKKYLEAIEMVRRSSIK